MNENVNEKNPFLSGPVFKPLLKFMLPILLANFLQAMYSAVDLMVIGRFANSENTCFIISVSFYSLKHILIRNRMVM